MLPKQTAAQKDSVIKLLSMEKTLIESAARLNLTLKRSSLPTLFEHLKTLSPIAVTAILENMSTLHGIFEYCYNEDVDAWDDRQFFALSMRAMGLTAPPDFMDYVGKEDIVEGYNMNRLQVFRNMRFMETSSYSLLEILSYEWPLLFDRPSVITDQIIGYCDEILWAANKTISLEVPEHFIREIRSRERRVCVVNFKYLAPIFAGPNKPYGMLGTCSARVVEIEQRADNISFV